MYVYNTTHLVTVVQLPSYLVTTHLNKIFQHLQIFYRCHH